MKPDITDCKLIGKMQTNLYYEMTEKKETINFKMQALRGSLVIYTDEGIFE